MTKKSIRSFIFSVIAFSLLCPKMHAAPSMYTAASCNQSDVNAVINGPTHIAVDGDTIVIPAGSCTWGPTGGGITVSSGIGISIIGAGQGVTNITDDLTSPQASIFLLLPAVTSSLSRISGMTILGQTGLGAGALLSPFAVAGTCNSTTCAQLRIDHVTFDGSLQGTIQNSDTCIVTDNVFGVLDHNSISGTSGQLFEFVNYNNSAWDGIGAYGDNSWASRDSFGTAKALYLENNTFGTRVSPGETESSVNGGEGGGRIVARFNTCTSCATGMVNHGTESDGRPRGGRSVEYYGNTFTCSTGSSCEAVDLRSGVAIEFGNSFTASGGSWFNDYLSLVDYRANYSFSPWAVCDGTGPYDNNDGIIYDSGTFTGASASGVTATVSDTSKSWSSSQWIPTGAPYAIHDVTTNTGAQITANTSNTVSAAGWTAPPNFNAGDRYQILRASICIDQPSRSGGTLLSGLTPSPIGGIGESLDPSYEWDDSGFRPFFGNVSPSATNGGLRLIANRDWYTDNSNGAPQPQTSPTSPFNGTSGVGFGTLASRPSTCTVGTAYWATDQGTWNTSGQTYTGGYTQGELFICGGSGWPSAASYTPYTYPHPLTLDPPTNLMVTTVQ